MKFAKVAIISLISFTEGIRVSQPVPDPVNHYVPVPSPNLNAATKTAEHTTEFAPPAPAAALA